MKSIPVIIISAFAFSFIGLLAAWGIGVCAPTPPSRRPDFERTMFILLPLGGAAVGWFIGYLATPFPKER